MPETDDFDICDFSHWETVYKRFTDFGVTPVIIEPMPNALHDHIKAGDSMRDECIDKALKMLRTKLIDIKRCAQQNEIASEIGISQAQVSRIEKSALERIRKEL